MINSDKIKGRMRELRLTQVDVANAIGVKPCTVNQKLNNVRPLDLTEAEKLCESFIFQQANLALIFLQTKLRNATKRKDVYHEPDRKNRTNRSAGQRVSRRTGCYIQGY